MRRRTTTPRAWPTPTGSKTAATRTGPNSSACSSALARADDLEPAVERQLAAREREIWTRRGLKWRSRLPSGLRNEPFRRGFPHPELRSGDPADLSDRRLESVPLIDLSLYTGTAEAIAAWAGHPRLKKVAGLQILWSDVSVPRLTHLLASPHLVNVRSLFVHGMSYDPERYEALTAAPAFARLESFRVQYGMFGPDGCEFLANEPRLASLLDLGLIWCHVGDAGLEASVRSPHLSNLRSLQLSGNGSFGPDAARRLAGTSNFRGLRRLVLSQNAIADDGRGSSPRPGTSTARSAST